MPANSVSTSVRTICNPRPVVAVATEAFGEAHAIVDDTDAQSSLVVVQLDVCVAWHDIVGHWVGVVDHVLQQLSEDDGQRRGHLGRQLPSVAAHLEVQGTVRRAVPLLDHAHERSNDLDERHVLPGFPRQGLVHQRNRPDAPHGFLDRRLGLG